MTERVAEYTVSPGLGPHAVAVVPPTEAMPIWCSISALARCAPEPRLPRLALVDDLGPLLPREDEATFVALPRFVTPEDVRTELRDLADALDTMRARPDLFPPDGAVPFVSHSLRLLADRIGAKE